MTTEIVLVAVNRTLEIVIAESTGPGARDTLHPADGARSYWLWGDRTITIRETGDYIVPTPPAPPPEPVEPLPEPEAPPA